jgi:hypothetical protein
MMQQPATTSTPRVRYLGGTRYLVESKSRPGLSHQVDTLRLRCGCEAGAVGRRCWHLVTALEFEAWRKREIAKSAAPAIVRPSGMAALKEPCHGCNSRTPQCTAS